MGRAYCEQPLSGPPQEQMPPLLPRYEVSLGLSRGLPEPCANSVDLPVYRGGALGLGERQSPVRVTQQDVTPCYARCCVTYGR